MHTLRMHRSPVGQPSRFTHLKTSQNYETMIIKSTQSCQAKLPGCEFVCDKPAVIQCYPLVIPWLWHVMAVSSGDSMNVVAMVHPPTAHVISAGRPAEDVALDNSSGICAAMAMGYPPGSQQIGHVQ